MNSARVFFVGGLISYRALFNFLQPAIYIPSMLRLTSLHDVERTEPAL